MLTATYTLVALSVEQGSIRASLQSLQKLLFTNFINQPALHAGQVGHACDTLQRLFHNCHWRKIDMFLIPAIRRATREADPLLDELDSLSAVAGKAVAAVSAQVAAAPLDNESAVKRFCDAVSAFCDAMLQRIEREEQALFPFARTVISGEAWFSVANHMLAHDAQREDERRPVHAARRAPQPPQRRGSQPSFAG